MKKYVYTVILALLLMFVVLYAALSGVGVLHVLGTADMGWEESPSWNVPRMAWGIVLNGSGVLLELLPYFLFGVLLGGFFTEFVSRRAIEKHMGQGGAKSIATATVAGCLVPICSCGIVPVLAGLVQTGLPLAPVIAFLIAAPMLNPATVSMTVGMIGWPMAIARIIAVFGVAMCTGMLVKRLMARGWLPNPIRLYVPPKLTNEEHQFFMQLGIHLANHPDGLATERLSTLFDRDVESDLARFRDYGLIAQGSEEWHLVEREESGTGAEEACFVLVEEGEEKGPLTLRTARALRYSGESFMGLAKYMLLAIAIAGAIKVLLPTALITKWLGGATVNSVFMAALLAVPMYICTCSDVPMVTALITKGMGGGAALAFLLGGPGLSIPSLAMLSGVFRWRLLLVYAFVSLVGCIAAGTIYNLFA